MPVKTSMDYILAKYSEVNAMSRKERQEFKRDQYNATPGNRDPEEYDCEVCLNKGNVMVLDENDNYQDHIVPCRCMLARRSVWSAKRAGIYHRLKVCDFPSYQAREPWQRKLKEMALDFAGAEGTPWLLLCGQSGCGKTHLALAVAGYILYRRLQLVRFLDWRNFNSLRETDPDKGAYREALKNALEAPILFIDDLLKLEKHRSFMPAQELEVAFQIINHRDNQNLQTIISTELTPKQLLEIDEAFGSRILARAKGYTGTVEKDPQKNYRLASL